MKKLFFTIISMLLLSLNVFADEKTDVLATFDKYVNDANSYSTSMPNYYTKNAKIIRVVNKKQGGQASVIIPFDRYLKELEGFHAGFVLLCEQCLREGIDVPIFVTSYVTASSATIVTVTLSPTFT